MKTMPPLTSDPPEPLYSCAFECCAIEITNPADRMFWCGDGWYCQDCAEDRGHEMDIGIRLSAWLALREAR